MGNQQMKLEITEQKAEWNDSPYGNEKLLCVVQFPNCISRTTGEPFKWMPTYKEIAQIIIVLERCEKRCEEKQKN
jgi:hypothetical protein